MTQWIKRQSVILLRGGIAAEIRDIAVADLVQDD